MARKAAILSALTACLLIGCSGLPAPRPSEPPSTPIAWGEEKDGVQVGILLSRTKYSLGERVSLTVFLRSTRPEFTCRVKGVGSWRKTDRGIRMFMLADATGKWSGTEYLIRPGTQTVVLTQEFATRPPRNYASDLHFNPGETPVTVLCAPMFAETDKPPLAGDPQGIESAAATVVVTEKKSQ